MGGVTELAQHHRPALSAAHHWPLTFFACSLKNRLHHLESKILQHCTSYAHYNHTIVHMQCPFLPMPAHTHMQTHTHTHLGKASPLDADDGPHHWGDIPAGRHICFNKADDDGLPAECADVQQGQHLHAYGPRRGRFRWNSATRNINAWPILCLCSGTPAGFPVLIWTKTQKRGEERKRQTHAEGKTSEKTVRSNEVSLQPSTL
eukprot:1141018-Pelagomonas_calceolata.AAC.7